MILGIGFPEFVFRYFERVFGPGLPDLLPVHLHEIEGQDERRPQDLIYDIEPDCPEGDGDLGQSPAGFVFLDLDTEVDLPLLGRDLGLPFHLGPVEDRELFDAQRVEFVVAIPPRVGENDREEPVGPDLGRQAVEGDPSGVGDPVRGRAEQDIDPAAVLEPAGLGGFGERMVRFGDAGEVLVLEFVNFGFRPGVALFPELFHKRFPVSGRDGQEAFPFLLRNDVTDLGKEIPALAVQALDGLGCGAGGSESGHREDQGAEMPSRAFIFFA
jgi:hypothetical protein